MFTGIVEEVGQIKTINSDLISVHCNKVLEGTKLGDSIAVSGVCLTVTSIGKDYFIADVSAETQKVTKFFNLKQGDKVNLERAMLMSSRFGGHVVTGHIDCVAKVLNIEKSGEFYNLKLILPDSSFKNYFVKKGSIAIDGMSLTIADCEDLTIKVAIIPHTFENTVLKTYKNGDNVNIEFDILAKYVEKNLLMNYNSDNITESFLKDNGFM